MKKITATLLTLLFATFTFQSLANSVMLFEEGTHYQVINKTATKTPNITEFFSFYCPHCYKFEFLAKEIEKQLPKEGTFKKSHVDFMRNTSIETQQALSRALVVAEKYQMRDKMMDAIFVHIHKKKIGFSNEADIGKLFAANGIDSNKFRLGMKSVSVKATADKMKEVQDDLSKRRILNGVPMFVVNGKYKLLSRELKSKEDYLSLVNFLLAKDN